jgi:hypothetical protein
MYRFDTPQIQAEVETSAGHQWAEFREITRTFLIRAPASENLRQSVELALDTAEIVVECVTVSGKCLKPLLCDLLQSGPIVVSAAEKLITFGVVFVPRRVHEKAVGVCSLDAVDVLVHPTLGPCREVEFGCAVLLKRTRGWGR